MARRTVPALFTLPEVKTISRAGSISSVRSWVYSGQLPSVKVGRHRLVRRADLARFLDTPIEDLAPLIVSEAS